MDKLLETEELVYPYQRKVDDMGEVFFWNNRVFRGIYHGKEDAVIELLDSGLLKELEKDELIVTTIITQYKLEKYSLILEHSKIEPIVYSYELTFDMIKNAAQHILKIVKISYDYDYQLKDCHLQNILFDGFRAKFVDIGSFQKIEKNNKVKKFKWQAEDEFNRVYLYPLTLWTLGFKDYAKKLQCSKDLIFTSTYYRLKYPFFNLIPLKFHYKILKGLNKYIYKHTNVNKLIHRLNKLELRKDETSWSGYHDEINHDNVRFNEIVSLINKYCKDSNSCVDIAGNQGILSKKVLNETHIKRCICLDYDEVAVNKGYLENKDTNLTFVNLDFMSSIGFINSSSPYERLKSDITLCMALTHHLILGQKYDIGFILKHVDSITNKYLFIEFMPKGLWTQASSEINIPNWYTLDWFVKKLEKYFYINIINEISDNRILIFGTKHEFR